MAKSGLRASFARLGLKRPRIEHLKRGSRALQARALNAVAPKAFAAPAFVPPSRAVETYLWRGDDVDAVKRAAASHPRSAAAVAHVIEEAEKWLTKPRFSVIDKLWTPPSGDKHDYLSGPSYWWPPQGAPEGTPWEFRDGHMNPIRYGNEYDLTRLDDLATAMKMLALGWRFTGRRPFADKAAELVRAWFIDPETAMKPNLTFAQIIPGRPRITGTGIIETLRFITVIDSLGLLSDSGAIDAADLTAMRAWIGQYVHWLRTSENGLLEQATNNNHGLSYDIQSMVYALFAGDEALAGAVGRSLPRRRIYSQIRGDGALPEEVRRREAFFYVAYGVSLMFDLATVAEYVGLDLWRYRGPGGSGIETALRALEPYALGRRPWPHGGTGEPVVQLYPIALRGARAYADPGLADLARRYAETLPLQPIDLVMPPPDFIDR